MIQLYPVRFFELCRLEILEMIMQQTGHDIQQINFLRCMGKQRGGPVRMQHRERSQVPFRFSIDFPQIIEYMKQHLFITGRYRFPLQYDGCDVIPLGLPGAQLVVQQSGDFQEIVQIIVLHGAPLPLIVPEKPKENNCVCQ
ncbi:MAG: hypothetical protein M1418_09150 [Deltaproteobacteria bacterium]|nr:hypothetical protein [Deltaproteobacteria bacterium]